MQETGRAGFEVQETGRAGFEVQETGRAGIEGKDFRVIILSQIVFHSQPYIESTAVLSDYDEESQEFVVFLGLRKGTSSA